MINLLPKLTLITGKDTLTPPTVKISPIRSSSHLIFKPEPPNTQSILEGLAALQPKIPLPMHGSS